jgi:hypothetical protein
VNVYHRLEIPFVGSRPATVVPSQMCGIVCAMKTAGRCQCLGDSAWKHAASYAKPPQDTEVRVLLWLDCPSECATDELNRIPDANMKWVMYSGLWYYASPGRGKLEARAQLLSTSMTETGVSSARVGASVAMFVNLAREALCFGWKEVQRY